MMASPAAPHAWRLGDLVAGFAEPGPAADRQVSALTLDSRAVYPGSLFLACQGSQIHGPAPAEEAARRGAAAILAETRGEWPPDTSWLSQAPNGLPVLPVPGLARHASALADRFYGEPSASIEVIGIAGHQGKTSLGHILAQALGGELPCGILGTLGLGFPGDLNPDDQSGRDAITLQAALAWLRGRGARALALELSSQTLEQGSAAAIRFSQMVLTGLGPVQLGHQGPGEDRDLALRPLFSGPVLGWAILNLDDPSQARVLSGLAPEVRVAVFARDPRARRPRRCDIWVRALSVEPGRDGLRIAFESSLGAGEIVAPLLGELNASNLLAVLTVLLSRGQPLEAALRALAGVRGAPGLMESFGGDGAPLVVVDEAHTPDALEKALTDLRRHVGGRVITVTGCGGDRDQGERPLMGAIAERLSDALILTDDNPRGEDGDAILAGILGGLSRPGEARVERQRGLAIRLAIALAGVGDLVLVAGRGHEIIQDLGELRVHFSDRAQVVEALREWREGHH